jgi:hypothetical protein
MGLGVGSFNGHFELLQRLMALSLAYIAMSIIFFTFMLKRKKLKV